MERLMTLGIADTLSVPVIGSMRLPLSSSFSAPT
jgi:hypothetical protein